MSDTILLSARCVGLDIINYGSKGSGFLSRMYQHATSSSDKTSADLRWITVSQSKPFSMDDGCAPDFIYDTVYTSEVFSELASSNGIYPSLMVNIKCPTGMNCNIRLNVYIESVKFNGGKPMILAGCCFSRKDLVGFDATAGVTYCGTMVSEFCVGAKAFVDVVVPMSVVGMNNMINPFAPLRLSGLAGSESSLCFPPNAADDEERENNASDSAMEAPIPTLIGKKDISNSASRKTTSLSPNPLATQYVFYAPDDATTATGAEPRAPTVQMNEMVFEPKRITQVPALYFENYADALKRSLGAWRTRRQLEGMRQGFFGDIGEAHAVNWHEVCVSVVEARLDCAPVSSRSANAVRPFTIYEATRGDVDSTEGGSDGKVRRQVLDMLTRTPRDCFPGLSESSMGAQIINTRERKKAGMLSWGRAREKGDVFRPSTYVNLSIHDENQLFEYVVGNTNTEYYQFNPVFGSNVQASCVKSPNQDSRAATNGVAAMETMDATYEYRRYDVKDSGNGETLEKSEERAVRQPEVSLVHGVNTVFRRYVPSCNNAYLMLDLCMESVKGGAPGTEYKAATPIVGTACIPLEENMGKDFWVPVEITAPEAQQGFPYLKGGWLRVEISVSSPTAESTLDNDDSKKSDFIPQAVHKDLSAGVSDKSLVRKSVAPAAMPMTVVYSRDHDGRKMPLREDENTQAWSEKNSGIDIPMGRDGDKLENLIADSYEWQWFCGYSGCDPAAVGGVSGLDFKNDSKSNNLTTLRPRVDVPYPIKWIDSHIEALESFLMEALEVLQSLREMHNNANGNCFRASVLKKDWQVQPLPVNFHMQMVTMRRLSSAGAKISTTVFSGLNPLAEGTPEDHPVAQSVRSDRLIDSLTCGCFTAHAMGFKKGGLETSHRNLLATKAKLNKLVVQYHQSVVLKNGFVGSLASEDSAAVRGRPLKRGLSPTGAEAIMLAQVRDQMIQYESNVLLIAKRQLVVMSQILTVCINALLFKLALVEEGYVQGSVAEQWMKHGFPVVFESLLSISGNERGMLEDTMVAVEMLAGYRFRIKKASEAVINTDNLKPHQRIRIVDPNSANVDLRGREIILTLSAASISKLPESIQIAAEQDTALINPIPVLFTQGLDIKQSIESVIGSSAHTESSAGARHLSSLELEHFVNARALEILDCYCDAVKPLSALEIAERLSSRENSTQKQDLFHPWLGRLAEHVRYTGKAEKNVQMLMEVQRVCHVLGGCKVTFCKSGKDRTGMVITLEQSRIIGERFGCGDSTERVIKDADLMRLHGPRLQVCTKNIGRAVFSMNKLQAQFLPNLLRPPRSTMEEMNLFKSDNT